MGPPLYCCIAPIHIRPHEVGSLPICSLRALHQSTLSWSSVLTLFGRVPNPKPCFERLAPILLDSESRQNADSQKIASDSTSVILLGHPTGTGRICFLPERLALATSSHCTFSQLVCCHVVCLPGFNESRLVYDSNDVSNIASPLLPS